MLAKITLNFVTFLLHDLDLSKRVEDVSLQYFLLSSFHLFDSICLGILWIDKLHSCVEGICFNINKEIRKRNFPTFHGNGCKEEKMLYQ